MKDRLVWLMNTFQLRARVFQKGPLCNSVEYHENNGLGYIHVLRRGTLKVNSKDGKSFTLCEPSLFFYMNPTSHSLVPKDEDVEMLCASFEFGSGLRNPLASALPDVVTIQLADIPALGATLDLLFKEADEHHCGQQSILDRLVEIVIVLILRDLMDEKRVQVGLLAGLADVKLARALNAIHAAPEKNWTLTSLAEVAGMSRARFAVKFREIVGTTPMAYLAEWRIAIAQSLLLRGKSVQLAADAVGYASASALTRVFTSVLGQTPGQWRKQHS